MDAMSTLQLSQLRERAAQLLRKYRIPLLVFLLGVALALVPGKTKKTDAQQTTAASADTAFDLSARRRAPRRRSSWKHFCPQSTGQDASG